MAETAVFSSFHRHQHHPARMSQAPEATDIVVAERSPAPSRPADSSQPLAQRPSDAPAPLAAASQPDPHWADLRNIPLDSDQLGLAHPDVVRLLAQLPGFGPTLLVADVAGIYRPQDFRPTPWSGFAYDLAQNARNGFAAGTRILTHRGEVEVEKLMPGDSVMVLGNPALLPISWIGRSDAAGSPVRIEHGALGQGVPRRTLLLGPDQAVFLRPEAVAARTLVNGTTIREVADGAELFHVDVGRPEVIFAEGIPLSSSPRASARPA